MKKLLFLIPLLAVLCSAGARPASAAEKSSVAKLQGWFKRWSNALKRSAVEARYKKVRTTAVAAVRGNKQFWGPEKPYWKGTWSEKTHKKLMEQREELDAAVGLILEGKYFDAEAKLDAFEKSHPDSPLLNDVKEARAKLTELKAAEAPAEEEPKAAEKAEEKKEEPKAAEKTEEKKEEPKAE